MTRPLIPFVQNGYYASRNWIPLVKGNGFTTSGGGEQEEVWETASGSIATFTAVPAPLRQLSVAVEPVQDLNGYDNPWPAGGGKNLLDSSLMADASTGAKFITLNLKPNTEYTMSSDDPCKDNGTITDLFFCNMDESVSSGTNGVKLNKSITRTSDANGQLRVGYRCYEAWITPEQLVAYHTQVEEGTATAFAPYSNICPISGHTDADVTRTGVNVWDGTYTADHVVRSTDGEIESSASTWCASNYIPVKGGSSYYLNDFSTQYAGVRGIAWYDKDKTYISGVSAPQNQNYGVQTAPENAAFLRVTIESAKIAETSINYPSTDTTYHAYAGNTYTIQLGQTVYGGTLDVVNGKMTVDRALFAASSDDLNGLTEGASSTNDWLVVSKSGAFPNTDGSKRAASICSHAPYKFANVDGTTHFYVTTNGFWLAVPRSAYPTFADFTNSLTGNNSLHCVTHIATPFELTLTPEQISTLQGTNNVWSDAGDVTVEYRAQ